MSENIPIRRGTEYASALGDVLEDQRARKVLRDSGRPARRGWAHMLWGAIGVSAALAVWAVVAPPAFLLPPPLPEPPQAVVEAGLRMDLVRIATDLHQLRDGDDALPAALSEVLERPEDADGITYERLAGGTFRLVGQRGAVVLIYDSSEPLSELRGNARQVLEGLAR